MAEEKHSNKVEDIRIKRKETQQEEETFQLSLPYTQKKYVQKYLVVLVMGINLSTILQNI